MTSDNMLQLVDAIGDFIEYWGFRRVHGRIWAFVYLSSEPPTTPEICGVLGISKAMASVSISELTQYKLLRCGEKRRHGAHSYEAEEDIAAVVRGVLRNRELAMLANALTSIDRFAGHPKSELTNLGVNCERLHLLRNLTRCSRDLLEATVSKEIFSVFDWLRLVKGALELQQLSKEKY